MPPVTCSPATSTGQTPAEIQRLLVSASAEGITPEYTPRGFLYAAGFQFASSAGVRTFGQPIKPDSMYAFLQTQFTDHIIQCRRTGDPRLLCTSLTWQHIEFLRCAVALETLAQEEAQ